MVAPTHIEAKRLSTAEAARVVHRALWARRLLQVTAEEAVALTGLPRLLAERGLLALAHELPTQLDVTESGGLIYRFSHLRRAAPIPQRIARLARRAWSRWGAPILEPGTWAVASLLVLALGSALMEASQHAPFAGHRSARTVEMFGAITLFAGLFAGLPFFIGVLTIALASAAIARVWTQETASAAGWQTLLVVMLAGSIVALCGWLLAKLQRRLARGRRLWPALRGFFLGPLRPPLDPLADERRLVALVRARAGVLSIADLVGAFGWTLEEAERELPRILIDYDGTLEIDEGLRLVARFERLTVHAEGAEAATDPGLTMPEPTPHFFGCSRRATLILCLLIAATAASGLLRPNAPLLPGPNQAALAYIVHRPTKFLRRIDDIANDGFGAWPLLLAGLPLAVRAALALRRRSMRQRRTRLQTAIAYALTEPRPAQPPQPLHPAALAALGGQLDSNGTLTFPELDAAHAVARTARATIGAGFQARHRIVFTTEDELS